MSVIAFKARPQKAISDEIETAGSAEKMWREHLKQSAREEPPRKTAAGQ